VKSGKGGEDTFYLHGVGGGEFTGGELLLTRNHEKEKCEFSPAIGGRPLQERENLKGGGFLDKGRRILKEGGWLDNFLVFNVRLKGKTTSLGEEENNRKKKGRVFSGQKTR